MCKKIVSFMTAALNYTKPGLLVMAVAAITCVVLVVCFLTNPISGKGELIPSTLTDGKKTNIEQAWAKMNYPINWDAKDGQPGSIRYYGNHEGFDIFYLYPSKTEGQPWGGTTIGSEEFRYDVVSCTLFGVKDGKVETLQQLYKGAKLSDEAISAVSAIHKQAENRAVDGELKTAVENAWYGLKSDNVWKWNDGSNSNGCQYYGSCNDYDILYFEAGISMDVVSEIVIADESFLSGSNFKLYAYKKGELFDLKELVEGGKVPDDAVSAMAKVHREWFPLYYSENE